MSNTFLFCLCSLVWGSTWFAISKQLGPVDTMWSLSYRFVLGAVFMWAVCQFRGGVPKYSPRQHFRFLFQGTFMCGLSYWLFYESGKYISSGMTAMICTTLLYFNVVVARVWLGNGIKRSLLIGAVTGTIGVCLIFLPQLRTADSNPEELKGLLLALGAVLLISLGSVSCEKNEKEGLAVMPITIFLMLYGGIEMGLIALLRRMPPTFDFSPVYLISLAYLVVFGSLIAMTAYITLIQKIGADRTAYVDIIYPVIALLISTFIEGYQWTLPAAVGVGIILLGNFLAIGKYFDRSETRATC
ncbi:DMT family transporter [Endozoicomonas arenosclerae]|uniref:DMT family transporter n=1 Tax=Endozoicomonas arenosclerae TaxID=1633495 RepID=UPI000781AB38|nr:DMT family transporter [Endozoicomonas arenosclerae]